MGGDGEPKYWDPDKALLVIAARMARGNAPSRRHRPRNPDEVAALALLARRIWRGEPFVERVDERTYRLL